MPGAADLITILAPIRAEPDHQSDRLALSAHLNDNGES
jgi:hypothetical protein